MLDLQASNSDLELPSGKPGNPLQAYQDTIGLASNAMVRKTNLGNALYDLAAGVVERLLAAVILVLTAPLMLLIAVAIRLDSPGGAVFTQQRIARIRDQRWSSSQHDSNLNSCESPDAKNDFVSTFTLYKFRTYHEKADQLVPQRARFEFDPGEIARVQLQLKDDPRITRVGRFLRRTSLDELPNFINVLKGEMRLIGPRPEVREMYRYYTHAQLLKFSVKPGITGVAQVNGRGKLNFKQTVDLDLWYVQNRSWRVDLKILLKTFRVVLTGDGSY